MRWPRTTRGGLTQDGARAGHLHAAPAKPNGHYHHLDTINRVRYHGSIASFIQNENIHDGIIYSRESAAFPMPAAPSAMTARCLRPHGDVYAAQNAMRDQIRGATTVISMATMLHTIATGNMTPRSAFAGRHGAAGVFLLRRRVGICGEMPGRPRQPVRPRHRDECAGLAVNLPAALDSRLLESPLGFPNKDLKLPV